MKDIVTFITEAAANKPIQMTVKQFFYYYNGDLSEDTFDSSDFGFLLYNDESKTSKDAMKYLEKYGDEIVNVKWGPVQGLSNQYEVVVSGLPEIEKQSFDVIESSYAEFAKDVKDALAEMK